MSFIKGMDISSLSELEKLGVTYYDNGTERDLFEILKNYGVNMIRLRLWHDPYDEHANPYGGGTNDFETTAALAERAINQGMGVLLDFHYSDFWTDPAKQTKPKEWQGLSEAELEQKVYSYTYDVLTKLKKRGLVPEMVQAGNELTNGLLWPDGHQTNRTGMVRLLRSGIAAIRDVDRSIRVILHLDNGGNNSLYRDWFDAAEREQLDYDIIGLSYYPYWHGTLKEFEYNLADIGTAYGKDLLVVETSYGYTLEQFASAAMAFSGELAKIAPYSATPQGQWQFMNDLMRTISGVPNHRGLGFIYWEPAWINVKGTTWATDAGRKYLDNSFAGGNSWANQALFDRDGNALPALSAIRDFGALPAEKGGESGNAIG